MAMDPLGVLASGILVTEFNDITGYANKTAEVTVISGYLKENIGQLNILINQQFNYVTGTGVAEIDRVAPPLKNEEGAILSKLYMRDYYYKLARNTLKGLTSSTAPTGPATSALWTEVREGDSFIRRTPLIASPTVKERSARVLTDIAKDLQKDLEKMAYYYNMYGALPRQVFGSDVYNYYGTYYEGSYLYGYSS